MYSVERVIAHNTLSLAYILAQGYNSNPFSRTRKAECIALGFFVCWSMAFRWSHSANQSDRAAASIGGGGFCVEKTHKPPWKTHGGTVERKKKIKSFFSPPNPQRDGISTGKRRTSPPAANLVSFAFLE